MFSILLDFFALSLALPSIATDLGTTTTNLLAAGATTRLIEPRYARAGAGSAPVADPALG